MDRPHGQIAVSFLVLMGFLLLLVRLTVNLGQMSQVRVETANAADAGALAGASWIASGQNEAAWVARKMWDAMWMTKALYLVPLCPGTDRAAYANALWQSLARNPRSTAPCAADNQNGCGPNAYFKEVANGAMEASFPIGAREFFTAAANNMLFRSPTAPDSSGCWILSDPSCVDPGGSLPLKIRKAQDSFAQHVIGGTTIYSGPIWSNGLPISDPQYLEHDPAFRLTYPDSPPKMTANDRAAAYVQYATETNPPPPPYHPCSLNGVGVRNRAVFFNPSTADPVAQLVLPLPAHPLAINATTGAKEWDRDLKQVIPSASQLDLGSCEAVCGMTLGATGPAAQIEPAGINPPSGGTVYAKISHAVTSAPIRPPGDLVWGWPSRFKPVASEATAQYTSARVTSNGDIRDIPDRSATATLKSVR